MSLPSTNLAANNTLISPDNYVTPSYPQLITPSFPQTGMALPLIFLLLPSISLSSTLVEAPSSLSQLEAAAYAAFNVTFDGLLVISQDKELRELYMAAAKMEKEDQIVSKALVVVGIMAGTIIVFGLAYYAKKGYCTRPVTT